jgi:hypothetical protein
MPQEGAPRFQPCSDREAILKKAASARREYDELRRKPGMLTGTEEYQSTNEERARAALEEAQTSINEYLKHVQEHGC